MKPNQGQNTVLAMKQSSPEPTDPLLMSGEPTAVEAEAPSVVTEIPGAEGRRTGTIPSEQEDVGLAEQMRLLKEEVQQLRQQVRGNSSTPADSSTPPLGRSLSTMKREQTRALQQQGRGSTDVTDTLMYTESGVRLTAGRAEDDLPPSYVAP
ncbi:hypothetical protein DFH06DRAFT_357154 [Mycena polygramma]|nr:hypothetical protein DFH06DRAFT_357154 [Mycena polygramma]